MFDELKKRQLKEAGFTDDMVKSFMAEIAEIAKTAIYHDGLRLRVANIVAGKNIKNSVELNAG